MDDLIKRAEKFIAQHEETGRMWKGYRASLPPRYSIVKGGLEP